MGLFFHHIHTSSFQLTVSSFSQQLNDGHNCLIQVVSFPQKLKKVYQFKSKILQCGKWQPPIEIYANVKIKSNDSLGFSLGDIVYMYTPESLFTEPEFIYQFQARKVRGNRVLTDFYFPKPRSFLKIAPAEFSKSPFLFIKKIFLYGFLKHHVNFFNDAFASFTMALLFAEQSLISFSHWNVLRNTGISHLVAISGLHVSMLACLFESIFLPICIPFNRVNPLFLSRIFSIICLFIYCCLASFTPSCQRAVLMYVCKHFAQICYFRLHPISNLLIACLIQYLISPLTIDHIGFQLSYGIVFSLLLLNHFPIFNCRLKKHLAMFIVINLWSLIYWNQIIFIASFSNFIAIFWLTNLILPLSILSLISSLMHLPFSHLILSFCHTNWYFLIAIMQIFSDRFKPYSF